MRIISKDIKLTKCNSKINNKKKPEAEFKEFEPWLVPLKIVLNFSRFRPVLNSNLILWVLKCHLNSFNLVKID